MVPRQTLETVENCSDLVLLCEFLSSQFRLTIGSHLENHGRGWQINIVCGIHQCKSTSEKFAVKRSERLQQIENLVSPFAYSELVPVCIHGELKSIDIVNEKLDFVPRTSCLCSTKHTCQKLLTDEIPVGKTHMPIKYAKGFPCADKKTVAR